MVNPQSTTATIRRQLAIYREALDAAGKPFPCELPCIKEVVCAKDRKTAIETAGPWLPGKYRDYATWGQDAAMPDDESFDTEFDDLLRDRFILGSPEDCFEQLRPYVEELGINHLLFRTHWAGMPLQDSLSSMRLISDELLPELKKLDA